MKKFLLLLVAAIYMQYANAQLLKRKNKDKEESSATAVDSTSTASTDDDGPKKKKGSVFQKLVTKVAKTSGNAVMGGMGVITTLDNLEDAEIIVFFGSNIYSKDLGIMFTDFYGKDWINNGDFSMMQLTSKDAYQVYKYPGVIKVNGKEMKHISMGVHGTTENPSKANKKITFEKDGKVEGSFEIPTPQKNIRLLSINGQTKNVKADFTKGMVLEFADYTTEPNSLIRVDVTTQQVGMRTLSMIAYVKPAAKVTIPAAAFRNIESMNKFNFKNCYLSVSDQLMVKAVNPTGKISPNQMVIAGSNDGIWVDVTNSVSNNDDLKIQSGNATIIKKNAAFAPPLSNAKTTTVSSFYTYGTTYLYDHTTSHWSKNETTKTIDFPEIPDSYLDGMLQNLYGKLTSAFTEVTGSTVLPAGTVPSLPAYENTKKFFKEEVNNDDEFLRVYNNLDPVRTLTSLSNSYFGDNVLLKEAKADALLKVSLVCQLSWEKKPMMTPYLTVELVGPTNGDFRSFMGNTKYFTMTIKGDDYDLKKNKNIEFDQIFQVDAFVSSFKKALADLKVKEQSMGDYEALWNLQR